MALLSSTFRLGHRQTFWRRAAVLGIALCLLPIDPPAAPAGVSAEYDLKAVFLFNFAQFVEWPAKAFPHTETPLVIGILGENPFGSSLEDTVRGERIAGHTLTVQSFANVEEIQICHILFISSSQSGRLDRVLSHLKGRSILTVGETERFAERGGMIEFMREGSKVRLKINLAAARASGLEISSKLLRVSQVIGIPTQ